MVNRIPFTLGWDFRGYVKIAFVSLVSIDVMSRSYVIWPLFRNVPEWLSCRPSRQD